MNKNSTKEMWMKKVWILTRSIIIHAGPKVW